MRITVSRKFLEVQVRFAEDSIAQLKWKMWECVDGAAGEKEGHRTTGGGEKQGHRLSYCCNM